MPKLVILGTASAVPDEEHENTHMVLVGQEHTLLIDCVNNPVVRLKKAGVSLDQVTDLILTHFHPDHVAGVPMLLMCMWLTGRKQPLKLYGLDYTLTRVEDLMAAFDWESWPNFFPIVFHHLPPNALMPIFVTEEWRVFSSPVKHVIPTIGLRIEFRQSNKVLVYSSDTAPCYEVVRLGRAADILIHEAAGETPGHSSARQAGAIAREARAKALYLIHYHTGNLHMESLVSEAAQVFKGQVFLAKDFMEFEF
jgi:ribonuclease Z